MNVQAALRRVARRQAVMAGEEGGKGLKVLVDEAGFKLAQKLFKQLSDDPDFSKFPAFMADLDQVLSKYRGKAVTEDDVEQIADELEDGVDAEEDEVGAPATASLARIQARARLRVVIQRQRAMTRA